MEYGHFSTDGLEYIVTNPVTPRPWINYLTNDIVRLFLSAPAGTVFTKTAARIV